MLNGYHSVKPLSEEEVLNLKIRLSYPWKFWKLVNYYANNHKAWISGRNSEKLQLVMRQQKAWSEFLKTCFSDFLFRQIRYNRRKEAGRRYLYEL